MTRDFVASPWTNLRVIGALGARAVKQTFRRPQLMAPIIIFPSLLLAIFVGGAGRGVELAGFPHVNGFLDFALAGAMIQSTLLAGNSGGIALAVDIEMGFTDRLLAAPISRYAIVLGRLAGTAALGAFSAIWFIAVGLCNGAGMLAMYAALARGQVSVVSPLVATYPLFTLALSALFLREERLGARVLAGVALTVAGVLVLARA